MSGPITILLKRLVEKTARVPPTWGTASILVHKRSLMMRSIAKAPTRKRRDPADGADAVRRPAFARSRIFFEPDRPRVGPKSRVGHAGGNFCRPRFFFFAQGSVLRRRGGRGHRSRQIARPQLRLSAYASYNARLGRMFRLAEKHT